MHLNTGSVMQAYHKLFQTYRICKKDIPDSHHELFIEKGKKSLNQPKMLNPKSNSKEPTWVTEIQA